jgi:voltage-gated potassium channel Kch
VARTGLQMRRRTTQAIAGSQAPNRIRTGNGGKLRYWFDSSMSRGTPALVMWLAAVTLVMIVAFTLFTLAFGLDKGHGFIYQLFHSLLHGLDPGTIGGDSGSWRYLLTMLVLTIAGLFVVSALIGVISAGIDSKIADLRRGRSQVIEADHTVILGWSDAVFTIVRELSIANESRRRPAIVILADKDKPEMEDELREKVGDLRGTRVVCRSGSPIDVGDLAMTSHQDARSVIVLSPDGEDADSEVIKSLLALTHDGGQAPIVAEIQHPSNLEAARLVGKGRVSLLDKRETVARLIVQTSRQSGAAAVFTELFDFDGSEIYFLAEHGLAGSSYGQAQLAFESAAVIGLLEPSGRAVLNPDAAGLVGDRVLVLVAEDDSAIETPVPSQAAPVEADFSSDPGHGLRPSRAMLIGWNNRAELIARELNNYAQPGSRRTILTQYGEPDLPDLANLEVSVVRGRTSDRALLDAHVDSGLDQLIVLCYSDDLPAQQADARTLVTLLHVRDILGEGPGPAVVSEMLDDRNRQLAEVAHVDDVIVSDELLSLMLSQLSEDPRLLPVFEDLLDADGAEIYLRPASWYVRAGQEASFATIVASASRRGETAFGYRFGSVPDVGGVVVNPDQSRLFPIDDGDRVVVLAER